jgi:hypothetical protein
LWFNSDRSLPAPSTQLRAVTGSVEGRLKPESTSAICSRAFQPSIIERIGVTRQVTGTFVVKLTPQECGAPTIGRMAIDKRFSGDLDGTSQGEMLAATTEMKSSAGYVALERVTGSLDGRSGTFVLQHSGTMDRGVPRLEITVVPDSGTGELTGLQGTMSIVITGGVHSYTLDYQLAAERSQS